MTLKVIKYLFVVFLMFFSTNAQTKVNLALSKKDSIKTVKMTFVGDLMCHSPQFKSAQIDSDKYDFSPVYRYVERFFYNSDFVVGNLETVLAGDYKKYNGYPFFNTPDDYLKALKETGFNLLFTSNNHAFDQGEKGVLRTIKKINDYGLLNIGTYKNQKDRDSIRIYNINGIKFNLLSYTWSINGFSLPKGKDYLVSIIDKDKIREDIKKAKEKNPDLIIVYFHFGNEYQKTPSPYQEDIVNAAIKDGADIIIASHPHVVQPIKYFKTNNAKIDTGFTAYSLGNFISNQRWRYSDGGPILNFLVTKNFTKDSVFVSSAEIIPTWVFKGKTKNGNEYIIIPSDSTISKNQYPFLSKSDRKKLVQSYFDIQSIMLKYTDKPKFYSPSQEQEQYIFNPVILDYSYPNSLKIH